MTYSHVLDMGTGSMSLEEVTNVHMNLNRKKLPFETKMCVVAADAHEPGAQNVMQTEVAGVTTMVAGDLLGGYAVAAARDGAAASAQGTVPVRAEDEAGMCVDVAAFLHPDGPESGEHAIKADDATCRGQNDIMCYEKADVAAGSDTDMAAVSDADADVYKEVKATESNAHGLLWEDNDHGLSGFWGSDTKQDLSSLWIKDSPHALEPLWVPEAALGLAGTQDDICLTQQHDVGQQQGFWGERCDTELGNEGQRVKLEEEQQEQHLGFPACTSTQPAIETCEDPLQQTDEEEEPSCMQHDADQQAQFADQGWRGTWQQTSEGNVHPAAFQGLNHHPPMSCQHDEGPGDMLVDSQGGLKHEFADQQIPVHYAAAVEHYRSDDSGPDDDMPAQQLHVMGRQQRPMSSHHVEGLGFASSFSEELEQLEDEAQECHRACGYDRACQPVYGRMGRLGHQSSFAGRHARGKHHRPDEYKPHRGEPKRDAKAAGPKRHSNGKAELAGPCCHCGTNYSPQWRKGTPEKPILCNACGIRLRRHKRLEPCNPTGGEGPGCVADVHGIQGAGSSGSASCQQGLNGKWQLRSHGSRSTQHSKQQAVESLQRTRPLSLRLQRRAQEGKSVSPAKLELDDDLDEPASPRRKYHPATASVKLQQCRPTPYLSIPIPRNAAKRMQVPSPGSRLPPQGFRERHSSPRQASPAAEQVVIWTASGLPPSGNQLGLRGRHASLSPMCRQMPKSTRAGLAVNKAEERDTAMLQHPARNNGQQAMLLTSINAVDIHGSDMNALTAVPATACHVSAGCVASIENQPQDQISNSQLLYNDPDSPFSVYGNDMEPVQQSMDEESSGQWSSGMTPSCLVARPYSVSSDNLQDSADTHVAWNADALYCEDMGRDGLMCGSKPAALTSMSSGALTGQLSVEISPTAEQLVGAFPCDQSMIAAAACRPGGVASRLYTAGSDADVGFNSDLAWDQPEASAQGLAAADGQLPASGLHALTELDNQAHHGLPEFGHNAMVLGGAGYGRSDMFIVVGGGNGGVSSKAGDMVEGLGGCELGTCQDAAVAGSPESAECESMQVYGIDNGSGDLVNGITSQAFNQCGQCSKHVPAGYMHPLCDACRWV